MLNSAYLCINLDKSTIVQVWNLSRIYCFHLSWNLANGGIIDSEISMGKFELNIYVFEFFFSESYILTQIGTY